MVSVSVVWLAWEQKGLTLKNRGVIRKPFLVMISWIITNACLEFHKGGSRFGIIQKQSVNPRNTQGASANV